jgi:hypothetical protein
MGIGNCATGGTLAVFYRGEVDYNAKVASGVTISAELVRLLKTVGQPKKKATQPRNAEQRQSL